MPTICPTGVDPDCEYCYRKKGRKYLILDPKGKTIDEVSSEDEARTVVTNYVASCKAAGSGYGGRRKCGAKKGPTLKGFTWG